MPASIGTRTRANSPLEMAAQGADTRGRNQDVGMNGRAVASCTFSASTGKVTAANGTFSNAGFPVQCRIQVEGANLNNGFFDVTAIDSTNQSFLTLAPFPKTEGPLSVTIRTV